MVDKRQFRADLFYRLSVFPVELPPLRERPEDIPLLVHHFAMDYADRMQKPIKDISEEFMSVLVRHSWPGNVRELQNRVKRAVIMGSGKRLTAQDLELTSGSSSTQGASLKDARETLEHARGA